MPTVCKIEFNDNPQKAYYSGQLLSGRVKLTFTKAKKLRGIFVKVGGKAFCQWNTHSTHTENVRNYHTKRYEKKKTTRTHTHTGNETYLKERIYLMGAPNGKITMEPGEYNFDFKCTIPPSAPSSLEATTGNIRYYVRVELEVPVWLNKKFLENFTVIKPVDLNRLQHLRHPVNVTQSVSFNPYCSLLSPVTGSMPVYVRVPVSGYTAGQTIDVEFDVDNSVGYNGTFRVELVKKIDYLAGDGNRMEEVQTLCGQSGVGSLQGRTLNRFKTSLLIPPTMPTDESSHVCKVQYVLKIIGSTSGLNHDAVVDVPITIGSFPFVAAPETSSQPAPMPYGFIYQLDAPSDPMPQISAPGPLPSSPVVEPSAVADDPPTYDEALKMK